MYKRCKSAEICRGFARVCRDAVRKTKAQFELKLSIDVQNFNQGFFSYVKNKQKHKESVGPLLSR